MASFPIDRTRFAPARVDPPPPLVITKSFGAPRFSTALGNGALSNQQNTATWNTALGSGAAQAVTTATGNTAVGTSALKANLTGVSNTALGAFALQSCTGASNTAVGVDCMCGGIPGNPMTGSNNTAVGQNAGFNVTTGHENSFLGLGSGQGITDGYSNAAVGYNALNASLHGVGNTSLGAYSLLLTTNGSDNTALGYGAGWNPGGVAANATTTGSRQVLVGESTGLGSTAQSTDIVAVGYRALCDGSYAAAIGSGASAGAAGAVAIGADHLGGAATTTTQDEVKLGTSNHTVNIVGLTTLGGVTPAAGDFLTVGKAGGFGARWVDTTAVTGGAFRLSYVGKVMTFDYYDASATYAGTYMNFDRSAGMKVAPFASQKMSFYGTTPIVQPTATPAAASDLASSETLVNYLRTQLLALGLIS